VQKVSIEEKLAKIQDYWNPRIAGELNGQQVKLAKLKGMFIWHKHDDEDEMFLVLDGELAIEFRDRTIVLTKNDFLIVPRGVEHRPIAREEVSVMLFEPASTLNTGDKENEMTKKNLERI
jgi:mannose-6-phosphate isomerase-like protein (cupin superfamily)